MLSRDKELPHHLKTSRSNTMTLANDSKNASAKPAKSEPANKNHENGTHRNPSGKRKANNIENIKCRNCQATVGGPTCDCLQRDKSLGQISTKTAKLSNDTKHSSQKTSQNDAKLLNRPTVKKAELEPRENMNRRHTSKSEKCTDRDLWLFASIPALNHPDFNPDQKKYLLSLAKIYTDVSPGRQYTNMWTRTTKLINIHQHDHCRKDTCKSAKSTKSRRENSTVKRKNSVPTAVDIFENGKAKEDKAKTEVKRSKSNVKSAGKTQNAPLAKESKADSKTHTESPSDDYVDSYIISIIQRQMEKLNSQHKVQENEVHGNGHAQNDSSVKQDVHKKESVETRTTEKTVVVITDSQTNQSSVTSHETTVKEVKCDSSEIKSEVTKNEKLQITELDQSDPITSVSVLNHSESLSAEEVTVHEETLRPQPTRLAAPITSVGAMECESVENNNEQIMGGEQKVQETDVIVQEELVKVERSDVSQMQTGDVETRETEEVGHEKTEIAQHEETKETEEVGHEKREVAQHEETTVTVSVTETRSTEIVNVAENDKDERDHVQDDQTETVLVVSESNAMEVSKIEDDYIMNEEHFQDDQEDASTGRNMTNETEVMEMEEFIQKETFASEMVMKVTEVDEGEVEISQLTTEEKTSINDEHIQNGQVESNAMEVSRVMENDTSKLEEVQHNEADVTDLVSAPTQIDVVEVDEANDNLKKDHTQASHVAMAAVVTESSHEVQIEKNEVITGLADTDGTEILKQDETTQENQSETSVTITEIREIGIVKEDDLSTVKEDGVQNDQVDVTTVVMESNEIQMVTVEETVQHERIDETTGDTEDGVIKAASANENEAIGDEGNQKEQTEVIAIVAESSEVEVVTVEGITKEEDGQIEKSVSLSNVATTSSNEEKSAQENGLMDDKGQNNQVDESAVVTESGVIGMVAVGDTFEEKNPDNEQTGVISSVTENDEIKVIQTEETDTTKSSNVQNSEVTVISVITESSEVQTVKVAEDDIVKEEDVLVAENVEIEDVARTNEIKATGVEMNDSVKEVEMESSETEGVRIEEESHNVIIVATESAEIEVVTVEENITVKEETQDMQVEVTAGEAENNETKVETEEIDTIEGEVIQNSITEVIVVTEVNKVNLAATDENHTMKDGAGTESEVIAVVTEVNEEDHTVKNSAGTESEVIAVVTEINEEDHTVKDGADTEGEVIQNSITEVIVITEVNKEDHTVKDSAGTESEVIAVVTEVNEEDHTVKDSAGTESEVIAVVTEVNEEDHTVKDLAGTESEVIAVFTEVNEEDHTVKDGADTEGEVIQNSITEVIAVTEVNEENHTMKNEGGTESEVIAVVTEVNEENHTVKDSAGTESEVIAVVTEINEEDHTMKNEGGTESEVIAVVTEVNEVNLVAIEKDHTIKDGAGTESEVIAVVTEVNEENHTVKDGADTEGEVIQNSITEVIVVTEVNEANLVTIDEDHTIKDGAGTESEVIAVVTESTEVEVVKVEECTNVKEEEVTIAESSVIQGVSETEEIEVSKAGEDITMKDDASGDNQTEVIAIVTESSEVEIVKVEENGVMEEEVHNDQVEVTTVVIESTEIEVVANEENVSAKEETGMEQTEVVAIVTENIETTNEEEVLNGQAGAVAMVSESNKIEVIKNVEDTSGEEREEAAAVIVVTQSNEIKVEHAEKSEETLNETTVEIVGGGDSEERKGAESTTAEDEKVLTDQAEVTDGVSEVKDDTVTESDADKGQVEVSVTVTETTVIHEETKEVVEEVQESQTELVVVVAESCETEVVKEEEKNTVEDENAQVDQIEVVAIVTESSEIEVVTVGGEDSSKEVVQNDQTEVTTLAAESTQVEVVTVEGVVSDITGTEEIEVAKEERSNEIKEDDNHSEQVTVVSVVTAEVSDTVEVEQEQNDATRVMSESGDVTVVRIEEIGTIEEDGDQNKKVENITIVSEVRESTIENSGEVITVTVMSDETGGEKAGVIDDNSNSNAVASQSPVDAEATHSGGLPAQSEERPGEHKEADGLVQNGSKENDNCHQTTDATSPSTAAQDGRDHPTSTGSDNQATDSASSPPGLPEQT